MGPPVACRLEVVAERAAFIVLATGSEDGGPVYCRGWRISPELVDAVAAEMPGEPVEWVWDDTDSGPPRVLFGEPGTER